MTGAVFIWAVIYLSQIRGSRTLNLAGVNTNQGHHDIMHVLFLTLIKDIITHSLRGFGTAIAIACMLAVAAPALAASGNSQASACGAVHGAFADVNGNFGFLGDDGGTPGYHNGATGQESGATGYNNSHTNCQG